CARSLYDYGYW
nr:immunoglobulin heavy chain junction region [Mus musculus]MBK4187328.1 immunoglobulin heavy chain junction region [Mus musculus]MBK4189887.1 immunoglobulin heavy chain junction region [Mus musculus]MBK4195385.1 immunoglobulin heavy chain junction region [Mus musculus]MBK4196266.1 immunoglobulin heavy chain junction region [Mus musculus]